MQTLKNKDYTYCVHIFTPPLHIAAAFDCQPFSHHASVQADMCDLPERCSHTCLVLEQRSTPKTFSFPSTKFSSLAYVKVSITLLVMAECDSDPPPTAKDIAFSLVKMPSIMVS